MKPAIVLVVVLAALIAGLAAGCSRTHSHYRYKLTLVLDVDGVERAGFNVVEVALRDVSFPESATFTVVTGEAIVIDLGPGRPTLCALLTRRLGARMQGNGYNFEIWRWREQSPAAVIWHHFVKPRTGGKEKPFSEIKRSRWPRKIGPFDLPDLVAFSDINDSRSILIVDPFNLQKTLGTGVSWKNMTIEFTDEPLTRGIEKKLGWLPEVQKLGIALDGSRNSNYLTVANSLRSSDFTREGF